MDHYCWGCLNLFFQAFENFQISDGFLESTSKEQMVQGRFFDELFGLFKNHNSGAKLGSLNF
jgi:hypothetical protein